MPLICCIFIQIYITLKNKHQDRHSDFLRLLAKSEPVLRAYIRAQVHDYHNLSEIVQNVYITGWKKFSEFRGSDGDFTKWLCVIGRFETLKYRQSLARNRLVLAENLVNQIADEGLEEISQYNTWIDKLEGCIDKLTHSQRDLIQKAYSPESSIKDLAKEMNKSPDALYQSLHRIRRRLSLCIGLQT